MIDYNELLNKLPFRRDSFYGLGLNWYGYDVSGNIAVFEGGDLPIPIRLFSDKEEYLHLYKFFQHLPLIASSKIVSKFSNIKTATGKTAEYKHAVKEAGRGCYFIEEISMFVENDYIEGNYLIAIPDKNLNTSSLPKKISELLKPYYFPVNFSEIDKLELKQFIPCE